MKNTSKKLFWTSNQFVFATILCIVTTLVSYNTTDIPVIITLILLEVLAGFIWWSYHDSKSLNVKAYQNILKEINLISSDFTLLNSLNTLIEGKRARRAFISIARALTKFKDDQTILKMQLIRLEHLADSFETASIENKFDFEIRLTIDDIYHTFIRFLNLLPQDTRYLALTSLMFWSEKTIGHPKFFLQKVTEISMKKNVFFDRVILVTKHYNDLNKKEREIIDLLNSASKENSLIRIKIVKIDMSQLLDEKIFAVCECPSGDKILLNVLYKILGYEDRSFWKVNFVSIKKSEIDHQRQNQINYHDYNARFEYWQRQSIAIDEYKQLELV